MQKRKRDYKVYKEKESGTLFASFWKIEKDPENEKNSLYQRMITNGTITQLLTNELKNNLEIVSVTKDEYEKLVENLESQSERIKYDYNPELQDTKDELANKVKTLAERYSENPETIADYLKFQAKFYMYSANNTLLIQEQNPFSTFVGSFKKWKDEGYSVKKGETGLKIWVPVTVSFFTDENGEWKKLSSATKEERELIKKGQIELLQKTTFQLGNVFDISQTTVPVEEYPKLFNMGYSSEHHNTIFNGIKKWSEEVLKCPIDATDVKSISLRGLYNPAQHYIQYSDKLNDTQRLSTVVHEIGHALLSSLDREKERSSLMKEVEADCISILFDEKLGLETPESRISHLAEHYKNLRFENQNLESSKVFQDLISDVLSVFQSNWDSIQKYIDTEIENTSLSYNQTEKEEQFNHNGVIISQDETGEVTYNISDVVSPVLEEIEAIQQDIRQDSSEKDIGIFTYYTQNLGGTGIGNDKNPVLQPDFLSALDDYIASNADGKSIGFFINEEKHELASFSTVDMKNHRSLSLEKQSTIKELERKLIEEYPYPDSSIKTSDLNKYGYDWNEMLPLDQEKAIKLFSANVPLYRLYEDNTETLIEDLDSLLEHKGLYGIEKKDWENFLLAQNIDISEKEVDILYKHLALHNVHNQVLTSFSDVAMRARTNIVNQNTEWGSWLARIVNDQRPQDYIDIDITGYNHHHEIHYIMNVVKDNKIINGKNYVAKTDEMSTLEESMNFVNKAVHENLINIHSLSQLITEYDVDMESSFSVYSPYTEKSLEDHYNELRDSGYDAFPLSYPKDNVTPPYWKIRELGELEDLYISENERLAILTHNEVSEENVWKLKPNVTTQEFTEQYDYLKSHFTPLFDMAESARLRLLGKYNEMGKDLPMVYSVSIQRNDSIGSNVVGSYKIEDNAKEILESYLVKDNVVSGRIIPNYVNSKGHLDEIDPIGLQVALTLFDEPYKDSALHSAAKIVKDKIPEIDTKCGINDLQYTKNIVCSILSPDAPTYYKLQNIDSDFAESNLSKDLSSSGDFLDHVRKNPNMGKIQRQNPIRESSVSLSEQTQQKHHENNNNIIKTVAAIQHNQNDELQR